MGRGLSGFPQSWVEAPRWCFHLDKPQGVWKEGQAREGSCRPPPPSGGDWDWDSGGTTRAEWRRNGGASLTHHRLSSQGCAVEMQRGGGGAWDPTARQRHRKMGRTGNRCGTAPTFSTFQRRAPGWPRGDVETSPSMLELLMTGRWPRSLCVSPQ